MPLSDWPQTSAFQLATPAWELTLDQFRGAMDGGLIFTPQSSSYWGTVNIATLEAGVGLPIETILAGMRAARISTNPDNMRSMKTLGGPPIRFIQFNVVAYEALTGTSALLLRDSIAAAV